MRPDYTGRVPLAWGYASNFGVSQRMLRHLTTGMAIVAGLGGSAVAQPQDQPQHARARLIAEQPALVPGTTAWLGVTFDLDKDWHLYWNGQNDTGFPIKLTPTFPEGYKLGEVLWPAPTRHLTDNFLDHIYEKRVTLLLPVQVPTDAKAGEKVTFKVEAEWLVCKTACLPGDASMSLTLPIAAATPGGVNPDARLFVESRANLPKALDMSKPELQIEWGADSVKVTAADHTKGLAFYPDLESAALTDLPTQGVSKSDTLDLRLDKPGTGNRLVGVVEIGPPDHGVRRLFAIDSARPALNPDKAGASNPKQSIGG